MKKIALLSALLLLAGCASAPIALDKSASGSTVTMKTGESFTVSLYSNPTTGYNWEIATPADDHICQNVNSSYRPMDTSGKLVGAGGQQQYTFWAVAPGKTKLKIVYRRSWEKEVPPAETFTLDVEVK